MKLALIKHLSRVTLLSLGLLSAAASLAQTAQCKYVVTNSWGAGATANIEITNTGSSAINGWSVSWQYTNNTITNLWNANLSGTNPYAASNLSWNSSIQPNQTVAFGFQINGNGPIETPRVNGAICSTSPTPSSASSSSSSARSSSSSVISSAVSSAANSSARSSSSTNSVTSSATSSSSAIGLGGLTSVQLTQRMGVGWNLGNSLDAVGGETNWGNPLVNQQLLNSVKAAGFKTVRIPVAWSQFSNATNFTISNTWMNRVEEVVNYALNADLFVIINIHWDNGWMQPTYAQQNYVNNRLSIMWTQIATRFKNYDDRLLFAGTNEVMVDGDYGTPTQEYYTVQNSFNQTFVDTVRATGGKNSLRHLVVQGFNTNIDHTVNYAIIPTDTASKRLMMEVHYYDPYNFTLNESSNITQWGAIATDPNKTETWANESYVNSQFQKMKTNFIDKGIGVILGEYGVVSRPNVSNHSLYRIYWNEYITEAAKNKGLVPVYWDNGYSGNFGFALFNRTTGAQLEPSLINAIINAGN